MIKITILIFTMLLVGCANNETRDQAAADAIAGTRAVAKIAPKAKAVANAIEKNIIATRGKDESELPHPQMEPEEIIEDQKKYNDNADKSVSDSSYGLWGWIAGGVVGLLALVRASGAGGPILSVIASVIENAATKKQKQHASSMAAIGVKTISIIESMPSEIADPIKKAVSKVVDIDQKQRVAIQTELQKLAQAKG